MKKEYSLRPKKMAGGQAESSQRDRKLTPLWKKAVRCEFFLHKAGILSGVGGEEGQGIEKNRQKLTPFEEFRLKGVSFRLKRLEKAAFRDKKHNT